MKPGRCGAVIHPAIFLLFRQRLFGRIRGAHSYLTSRQHYFPVLLIFILGFAWLGQFVFSLTARVPLDSGQLREMVVVLFASFALWPILKSFWKRTGSESNWSPAEQVLLCHGPFRPIDLVFWQLLKATPSIFFKATIAALLILPDVASLSAAFLGILLSLCFLELARYGWERSLVLISRKTFRTVQLLAIFTGVVATFWIVPEALQAFHWITHAELSEIYSAPTLILPACFNWLVEHHCGGMLVIAAPFADLIASDFASWPGAIAFLNCMLMLCGLVLAVWSVEVRALRTGVSSVTDGGRIDATMEAKCMRSGSAIPHLRGIGPILWRQLLRFDKQAVSTVIASLPVILFAVLPSHVAANANGSFLMICATLAFLSFVLMPAIMRFDFRNDFDHLQLLKQLAISPVAIVLGQLAVPVVGLTILQAIVLGVAYSQLDVSRSLLVLASLFFPMMNFFVFGFENFLFILAPYRFGETGLSTVIRTLLTFSAKMVAITASICLMILWATLAQLIVRLPLLGHLSMTTIFLIGVLLSTVILAGALLWAITRQFERLEVQSLG